MALDVPRGTAFLMSSLIVVGLSRRLILTLRPTSLGTTTFRDNVTDPKIAWKVCDKFIRLIYMQQL